MFDRYVVDRTRVNWKRRALVIASVVVHVAAGLAILVWSFFHVEEIVPPSMAVTVFSAPPPPPPPPPPAAHHKAESKPKPQTPQPVTQPTEIPKIVQPKQEEKKEEEEKPDEDGAQEGGEEGGVKGGEVGGVKGGTVGGVKGGQLGGTPGGNGTDSAKGPAPKIVPQFMFDRERINYPDPHLPEWFKQQHPTQTVRGMYRICVRTDGRISDVIPMTSIPGLDQTVIDQLKATWVYKPQPVPVCSPRVFLFKIN